MQPCLKFLLIKYCVFFKTVAIDILDGKRSLVKKVIALTTIKNHKDEVKTKYELTFRCNSQHLQSIMKISKGWTIRFMRGGGLRNFFVHAILFSARGFARFFFCYDDIFVLEWDIVFSGPYAGFFCQGGKRAEGPYIFKYEATFILPYIFKVR